jgi:adenylyl cyclase-associated protein
MSLPPQHIDEAWSAAEFWCNKVLLEHKSKDSGVQPWVAAIKEIVVVALKGFVAQYYPTGPVWGTHNISKSSTNGGGRAPPPPPPPPPPSGSLAAPKPNNTINNSTTSVGALLAEINAKGSGITAGLKKVTSDMKTKNIFKDGTGTCTGMGGLGSSNKPSTTAAAAAAAAAAVAACIGRMECEQGRKWVVENHTNNKDLQITETEPKQAIYIYNCTNCTIQVSGKVNSIAVDKCSNTALLFDTTVASCEVVNSSKVQIQWTGLCPTVAVDKTDGCQLYIPRQTVELCEVNTAKSSEVNVIILPDSSNNNNDGEEEEEEDAQESAIPEQFVSRYMGGKWTTEPVNHGSG